MPIYKDEDGNEVDAIPVSEVEEQLNTAKEEAIEELTTKHDEEVATFQAKLDAQEEEMDSMSSKDKNWKAVRESNKALQDKLNETDRKFDEKIKEYVEPLKSQIVNNNLESSIKKFSGGDEEMAKKIRLHYDSFSGEPKDEEAKQERIKNASLLAGVAPMKSGAGNASFSSTGGSPGIAASNENISPAVKDMGKKLFGLADDDFTNTK